MLTEKVGGENRRIANRVVHELHQLVEVGADVRLQHLEFVRYVQVLGDPLRPSELGVTRVREPDAEGSRALHVSHDERAVDAA